MMADTFDALAGDLRGRITDLGHAQQWWLAIAGPPGAGKSTLSHGICQRIGTAAVVLPMDGYHYYRSELDTMSDPIDAHRRRGAPFTFNAERFVAELSRARELRSGQFPSFQHGVGDPQESDIKLDASVHRLVIVEGNYLLLSGEPWCRLQRLFDETWFVDTPIDVIRKRLTERFVRKGLSPEAATERIQTNDLLNAELVCRGRHVADRLVRM